MAFNPFKLFLIVFWHPWASILLNLCARLAVAAAEERLVKTFACAFNVSHSLLLPVRILRANPQEVAMNFFSISLSTTNRHSDNVCLTCDIFYLVAKNSLQSLTLACVCYLKRNIMQCHEAYRLLATDSEGNWAADVCIHLTSFEANLHKICCCYSFILVVVVQFLNVFEGNKNRANGIEWDRKKRKNRMIHSLTSRDFACLLSRHLLHSNDDDFLYNF